MRYVTTTVLLTGLFLMGFTASPAEANCHSKLKTAQAQLASLSKDAANYGKIKGMINKAAKNRDHKEKKKMCGNILKKANKLMAKAGGGGGKKTKKAGKCAPLIQKVRDNIHLEIRPNRVSKYNQQIQEAQGLLDDGKDKKCAKRMKTTLKNMGL